MTNKRRIGNLDNTSKKKMMRLVRDRHVKVGGNEKMIRNEELKNDEKIIGNYKNRKVDGYIFRGVFMMKCKRSRPRKPRGGQDAQNVVQKIQ